MNRLLEISWYLSKHFVIVFLVFISGCVSLQHSADYSKKKSIIVYPIVNATDKKIIRSDYFNERVFFPDYIDNPSYSNILKDRSAVDEFSDRGYIVFFSSEVQNVHVSTDDLIKIREGSIPLKISQSLYDYSIVVSIDSFELAHLTASRVMKCTLFMIENGSSKLLWSKQVSRRQWRGILGGPIDAIFEAFGDESGAQDVLRYEMSETIRRGILECPLFQKK